MRAPRAKACGCWLHFVLGQTIEEALERAEHAPRCAIPSTCWGGRARRRTPSATASYARHRCHRREGRQGRAPDRPSISVKLSALHPRFEPSRAIWSRRVGAENARAARKARADLNFTVDAEEADRLELTLDGDRGGARRSLAGWEGFGLAVQAYQKRAPAVIDWLAETARGLSRRLMVRLVKGAYWDTEVKRAQERGLADYPVFTRKPMTDLCYAPARASSWRAGAALSAIRHPQRAHRGERDRGRRRRRGLRVPAPARHGRDALRPRARGLPPRGLPRLRAGRWPSRSSRLSGAALAGERRQPRSSRSPPILRCRSRRFSSARRTGSASRAARATRRSPAADLYGRERRNSAGVEFGDKASSTRCSRISAPARRRARPPR